MNSLTKLVEHCVWANDSWIHLIAEQAAPDEYAVRRISHILLGEQAWFQRIEGDEPDRDIWRALSLPALREMHGRHRNLYSDLLRSDIDRIVAYTRFTGEQY
jgi:hypothetical protein